MLATYTKRINPLGAMQMVVRDRFLGLLGDPDVDGVAIAVLVIGSVKCLLKVLVARPLLRLVLPELLPPDLP